jgi:hypothetical protein
MTSDEAKDYIKKSYPEGNLFKLAKSYNPLRHKVASSATYERMVPELMKKGL